MLHGHTLASLNITTRGDRTARATGSRRVRNEYPGPDAFCPTIYTAHGALSGSVPRVTVGIFPDRYRVDYSASGGITRLIDVAIFDQRRDGDARLPLPGRNAMSDERVGHLGPTPG